MSQYSNRGMIKWMPFQSLNEQATYLQQMRANRSKVERPHISSDVAECINLILTSYQGELVEIRYYDSGVINKAKGIIKYIDNFAKRLRIEDIDITFKDILDIQEC